jgi:hypothetical protein
MYRQKVLFSKAFSREKYRIYVQRLFKVNMKVSQVASTVMIKEDSRVDQGLFARMTKTFLCEIRVVTKDKLKQKTLKWIEMLNKAPVVF